MVRVQSPDRAKTTFTHTHIQTALWSQVQMCLEKSKKRMFLSWARCLWHLQCAKIKRFMRRWIREETQMWKPDVTQKNSVETNCWLVIEHDLLVQFFFFFLRFVMTEGLVSGFLVAVFFKAPTSFSYFSYSPFSLLVHCLYVIRNIFLLHVMIYYFVFQSFPMFAVQSWAKNPQKWCNHKRSD